MHEQIVRPSGIGVFNYSAPASVVFNDKLYLFYNGSGDNGIWYVKHDENTWPSPISCRGAGASAIGVAKYTSPCPVVFNNKLYLFFNGAGNDGTWYTASTDGSNWSEVFSVMIQSGSSENFAQRSSPSAVVHQGRLYLFWNSHSNDGLRYSTYDGKNWDTARDVSAPGLGIRGQTSSAAVEFNGSIFLFYNGTGNNGTWMTQYAAHGSWSPVVSLSPAVGGMGFLDLTSSAAFVSDDSRKLTLMWNGSGNDGVWYSSTTDGTIWNSPAISLRSVVGSQKLLLKTSACGVSYRAIPYIFWVAEDNSLWLSQGLTINVDNGDFNPAHRALLDGNDFTLTITDPATISFFQPRFGPGPHPLPGPDGSSASPGSGDYARVIKAIIWSSSGPINEIVAGILAISLLASLKGYDVDLNMAPFRLAVKKRPVHP